MESTQFSFMPSSEGGVIMMNTAAKLRRNSNENE